MITLSRKKVHFSIICLAMLLFSVINAASAGNKDKNDIPWYQVEVIIFANLEQSGMASETWPDNTALQNNQILELIHPDDEYLKATSKSQVPDFSAGQNNMPTPYELLGKNELQLIPVIKKLQASRKYKPLLHIGWRQPTLDPKKAQAVYIFDGVDLPTSAYLSANQGSSPRAVVKQQGNSRFSSVAVGNFTFDSSQYGQLLPVTETDVMVAPSFNYLSGTLKLGVSRYLHLAVDLNYRVPVQKEEQVAVDESGMTDFSTSPVSFNQGTGEAEPQMTKTVRRDALQNFHLFETRRMRSKEIHYFDHPMISVIARVIPLEIPKVEPAFDPASQAFTKGSEKQKQ